MYHQCIETPSSKGHGLKDSPGLGLPTKNWAQTLWVDLLPSKVAARLDVSQVSGGEPQNDLQNATLWTVIIFLM